VSDGIIAPGYEPEALEILKGKRGGKFPILQIDAGYEPPLVEMRQVFGFDLYEERNVAPINPAALGNAVSPDEVATLPAVALPVIVMGEAPRTLKLVQETEPAQETEVVAVVKKLFVPLAPKSPAVKVVAPVPPFPTAIVVPFQMPSFTVPVVSTRKALPAVPTEKSESGEVVAMPTFPPFATMKLVAVEEPTTAKARARPVSGSRVVRAAIAVPSNHRSLAKRKTYPGKLRRWSAASSQPYPSTPGRAAARFQGSKVRKACDDGRIIRSAPSLGRTVGNPEQSLGLPENRDAHIDARNEDVV
jgi:hypothetical protein